MSETHRSPRSYLAIACLCALGATGIVATEAGGSPAAPTPRWLGAVPGLGPIAPDPMPVDAPIRLSGCTVTNPLFPDDPTRLRRFVPAGYELGTNGFFGPDVATIVAGVLACGRDGERQGISIDGGPAVPTVISLVAVQVVADPAEGHPADPVWDLYNRSTLNFLPSSSWYLIDARTDNAALAARLRRTGLPVAHTPRLAYQQDYEGGSTKRDSVSAPTRRSRYRLTTTTMFPDSFDHNHDWFFWYDRPQGRTGFFLHLHAMSDSSCGYHASPHVREIHPSCKATLRVSPRSKLARLLGASSRTTPYAFNHPPSHAPGYIDLPVAGQRSSR